MSTSAAAVRARTPGGLTTGQASRAFRGLLAARLLGALADGVMLPFVVLWAHREGGLSGAAAGAVFLVQALGELAGGLAGGALADRIGHRRMLLISTTGMALGYGSLLLIHHAVPALGAFLLAGLFESAFHPTVAALIGDLHDGGSARRDGTGGGDGADELHRAYGLARMAASVGGVAGPILGAVAVAFSLSGVFAAAGVLLGCAAVVVFVAVPSDRATGPQPGGPAAAAAAVPMTAGAGAGADGAGTVAAAPSSPLRALLRDRRLGMLVLGGGLLSITFTWWEADGLVLLRPLHHLSTTAYALLFAVDAVATVLFQIPVSRWAGRRDTGRLLLLGAALQGAGLAGLAAAGLGYPALVAAVLVTAFGQMLSGPATSAFVSRRAAPGRRATYQAALSTTQDIGTALGPTSGLALGRVGSPALVWLLALPLSLAAGLATARATTAPAGSGPAVLACAGRGDVGDVVEVVEVGGVGEKSVGVPAAAVQQQHVRREQV